MTLWIHLPGGYLRPWKDGSEEVADEGPCESDIHWRVVLLERAAVPVSKASTRCPPPQMPNNSVSGGLPLVSKPAEQRSVFGGAAAELPGQSARLSARPTVGSQMPCHLSALGIGSAPQALV